jgi:hypothetical protein
MESRTEFNLIKNIKIWKSELSQNSNMTKDNIDELESHLYDQIDDLQLIGLSTEESLLIAKSRIGNTKELTTEYGKVNKKIYFSSKITPYLKGILLFIAFTAITNLISNISLLIASRIGVNSENLNYVSIGILTLLSSIIFILGYKKYKNMSLNTQKLTSIPFLISLVIFSRLLSLLGNIYIPKSGFTELTNFAIFHMNLSIYNIIFIIFIMAISFFTYNSSKKDNKVKISE